MSGFGFSASSTHGAAAPKGHLETHGSSYLRPTLWPYRVHMVRPGRRPHVETTALAQCDIHVKESKVWNQAAYNPLLLRSAAAAAPVRPPPGGRGKPQPASPPRPKMAAWLPRRPPGSNMAPGRSAGLWTTSPRSERARRGRRPCRVSGGPGARWRRPELALPWDDPLWGSRGCAAPIAGPPRAGPAPGPGGR